MTNLSHATFNARSPLMRRVAWGTAMSAMAVTLASPAMAQAAPADPSPAGSTVPAEAKPVESTTTPQIATTSGEQSDVRAPGDIIVTAQRREERLQDVPAAISAVDSELIERRRVVAVADLPAIAPGVSVGLQSGVNRLFIRGIGLTSQAFGQDSSVAFYVDGVPIGRPAAQLSSFFDLERIEVLRGPQGTLYGRNATGGSVNLISHKPTSTLEGYVEGLAGNYGLWQLNAAVGGPLNAAGTIRGRIAVQTINHGGYGRNVFLNQPIDDENRKAVRGSLDAELGGGASALLIADYSRERDHNYAAIPFGPYRSDVPALGVAQGANAIFGSRNIASDVPVINWRENWGINGTIDVPLGASIDLKSITSYRHFDRFNTIDVDGTTLVVGEADTTERSNQFTEDLQLVLTTDRINAVFGGSYYKERLSAFQIIPLTYYGRVFGFANPVFQQAGHGDINAAAAFGELTYKVTNRINLTAGLRYSHERRTSIGTFTVFNFKRPPAARNVDTPIDLAKSWNALTPKFGVDFKATESVLLYASATRGFKSGVLNLGSTNPAVNPEYIWSYEAGIKSNLFDNHLTANLSAFLYNYSDLQVTRVSGAAFITVNAAKARVKGVELSLQGRATARLRANLDVAYLDAEFTSFSTSNPSRVQLGILDLSGNALPQAPRWTINGGAEYEFPIEIPGSLSVRADVSWRSRVYFSEFNDLNVSQSAYAKVDASIEYQTEGGRLRLGAFAKNLTNKLAAANYIAGSSLFGFVNNGAFIPPRTYGVRAMVNF